MITRERTRMSKVMQSFRSQQLRLFLLNRSRNSPKWNCSYSKDVKVSGRIEGFIDYENLNITGAGCSNWLHFYIYSLDTQQVFYT